MVMMTVTTTTTMLAIIVINDDSSGGDEYDDDGLPREHVNDKAAKWSMNKSVIRVDDLATTVSVRWTRSPPSLRPRHVTRPQNSDHRTRDQGLLH